MRETESHVSGTNSSELLNVRFFMCRRSLRPASPLWAAGSHLFVDKHMRNADEDTQEGDSTLKVSFRPLSTFAAAHKSVLLPPLRRGASTEIARQPKRRCNYAAPNKIKCKIICLFRSAPPPTCCLLD